jgi:hypothetical protein
VGIRVSSIHCVMSIRVKTTPFVQIGIRYLIS